MAVPSIIRVLPFGADIADPVEGPVSGRQLVEIYGDGFRLPNQDPVVVTTGDIVTAESPQSVSVTFGGVEALEVGVAATNRLVVLTPPSPVTLETGGQLGIGAVDVVVQNLDDNGDPIVGESVTAAGAYTYRYTKLDSATESDFARLVRTMIRELRRRVLNNVVFTTDTDFDSDTSSAVVDIATLPAIVLQGPGTPENRFYSLNGQQNILESDDVHILRKVHTVDLTFDIVGISNHPVEALNLMSVCTQFVENMPFLSMARDPDDSSKGDVQFEFDFDVGGGFALATRPNSSNIHTFSGSVIVRGFDFEGLAGFTSAEVVGLTAKLGDTQPTLLESERFGD